MSGGQHDVVGVAGLHADKGHVSQNEEEENLRKTASHLLHSYEDLKARAHAFEEEALREHREAANKVVAAAEMRKAAERLRAEYLAARRKEEVSCTNSNRDRSNAQKHVNVGSLWSQ